MLQALYSRSVESALLHIKKAIASGAAFMRSFFVGFGHKSIGDCGTTTVFNEGVSMLAAKAIQDSQLYNGQETSTRYIDMAQQAIIDPAGTFRSGQIMQRWMDFYNESQAAVDAHLRAKYPKKEGGEDEALYTKAIKARVFDIMRGFLPAGITTNVSWHVNLRQAHDRYLILKHNPVPEIQEIANEIMTKLKEKYPDSFGYSEHPTQEEYNKTTVGKYNYFSDPKPVTFSAKTSIINSELEEYMDAITTRPEKTLLPVFLEELGGVTFNFLLDFGSFRDIQRQRHGVCRMPILDTKLGFNQWYLDQLPDELREKAITLISLQKKAIEALDLPIEQKQYYVGMGFNVSCRVTYGLPATVYVVELRSGRFIHPTLRRVAHQMHHFLRASFPNLKLHSELDSDDWDIRRGKQDITRKS